MRLVQSQAAKLAFALSLACLLASDRHGVQHRDRQPNLSWQLSHSVWQVNSAIANFCWDAWEAKLSRC
jgi:hypothetical protein